MSWILSDHVNHGRDHFNYSEWATYDGDDQDKLLGNICSWTKKGRMPLPSYLWLHRDAALSASEVAALCAWSDRVRDTLQ
jgi:Haem-binding domain